MAEEFGGTASFNTPVACPSKRILAKKPFVRYNVSRVRRSSIEEGGTWNVQDLRLPEQEEGREEVTRRVRRSSGCRGGS
jgi:hypothetical protein